MATRQDDVHGDLGGQYYCALHQYCGRDRQRTSSRGHTREELWFCCLSSYLQRYVQRLRKESKKLRVGWMPTIAAAMVVGEVPYRTTWRRCYHGLETIRVSSQGHREADSGLHVDTQRGILSFYLSFCFCMWFLFIELTISIYRDASPLSK